MNKGKEDEDDLEAEEDEEPGPVAVHVRVILRLAMGQLSDGAVADKLRWRYAWLIVIAVRQQEVLHRITP